MTVRIEAGPVGFSVRRIAAARPNTDPAVSFGFPAF
jgi:hypothetical protein